ncbi:hypothetical protein HPP92_010406 [Vanilla planifolia]|nr:hypothetical protein HPP92_010406 [Vanilla planifolia]
MLSDKERVDAKNCYGISSFRRFNSLERSSFDVQEEAKVSKVSPPRRKAPREEKSEKKLSVSAKVNSSEGLTVIHKNQNEVETPFSDGEINALLEEEEALISAHRKEIENTMEIVREEMNLLAEVDRPGSQIDSYVSQLNFLLSRKAAGLVSLQARLARFQHRLKEHEILSRRKGSIK